MCGITGAGMHGGKADSAWISKMTDTIRHRGPDDEGYLAIASNQKKARDLIGNDSQVSGTPIHSFNQPADFFLGHRRLSILDPTPSGHQPMSTPDQQVHIVFNGEIYNYIELRETLKQAGHPFKTGTDTEVLLAAYQQWGEECLVHLDGMWSFVLYDARKNILFGSRDRFGVKPLYYYHKSPYFAFASELKSLVSLPFLSKRMESAVIFDYLVFGGLDFVEQTFFQDILELQPSHAFRYNLAHGELHTWRYYTLQYRENWESFDEKKCRRYVEDVKELVFDAVRLRLRSDVPVGSALSGGIDSSAVVCVISKLLEQDHNSQLRNITGDRQKVFTAGFPGNDVDESDWARQAAQQAGAQWFLTAPQAPDYLQDMEDIAYHQDIPFGSPMVYAQYRVMKLAGENGVKVLLDGQGADELFTGYTMYYSVFYQQMLKHMNLKSFRNEWRNLHNAPLNSASLKAQLFKQFRRSVLPYSLIRRHRLKPKPHHRFLQPQYWDSHKHRFDLIKARDFTSLNAMLFEFYTRQKLGNLLRYEDRNSMRFSIESRTPFSDHLKLIEYVFNIPAVYKIHNGWSKYLLREAMKGIIPETIRTRTDKKGFFIPDIEWLSGLKDHFIPYLTPEMEQFVNVPAVIQQLNQGIRHLDYESIQTIWNILGLAVWRKVYQL